MSVCQDHSGLDHNPDVSQRPSANTNPVNRPLTTNFWRTGVTLLPGLVRPACLRVSTVVTNRGAGGLTCKERTLQSSESFLARRLEARARRKYYSLATGVLASRTAKMSAPRTKKRQVCLQASKPAPSGCQVLDTSARQNSCAYRPSKTVSSRQSSMSF